MQAWVGEAALAGQGAAPRFGWSSRRSQSASLGLRGG